MALRPSMSARYFMRGPIWLAYVGAVLCHSLQGFPSLATTVAPSPGAPAGVEGLGEGPPRFHPLVAVRRQLH